MKGYEMKERLKNLWEEDDPETMRNLEIMTPTELFDAWLTWEGIIGYTYEIIEALKDCGFKVEEME